MYQRSKITSHSKCRRNCPSLSLIPGAVFCLLLTEKWENSTQSPAASGSGLGSCLLLSLTETNSKAFTVNNTSWGSAWNWQFFFFLKFPVQKYGTLAIFVNNHQFKGLKNNLDFNTRNYSPLTRSMKSAGRLSPGPQCFVPPHDPDPRTDVSGLPLQSGGAICF